MQCFCTSICFQHITDGQKKGTGADATADDAAAMDVEENDAESKAGAVGTGGVDDDGKRDKDRGGLKAYPKQLFEALRAVAGESGKINL